LPEWSTDKQIALMQWPAPAELDCAGSGTPLSKNGAFRPPA
jgi:hypothetical protein